MEWFIQHADSAECLLIAAIAIVGFHFRQNDRITAIEASLRENVYPALRELRDAVGELRKGLGADTGKLTGALEELDEAIKALLRVGGNRRRIAPRANKRKRNARKA